MSCANCIISSCNPVISYLRLASRHNHKQTISRQGILPLKFRLPTLKWRFLGSSCALVARFTKKTKKVSLTKLLNQHIKPKFKYLRHPKILRPQGGSILTLHKLTHALEQIFKRK